MAELKALGGESYLALAQSYNQMAFAYRAVRGAGEAGRGYPGGTGGLAFPAAQLGKAAASSGEQSGDNDKAFKSSKAGSLTFERGGEAKLQAGGGGPKKPKEQRSLRLSINTRERQRMHDHEVCAQNW